MPQANRCTDQPAIRNELLQSIHKKHNAASVDGKCQASEQVRLIARWRPNLSARIRSHRRRLRRILNHQRPLRSARLRKLQRVHLDCRLMTMLQSTSSSRETLRPADPTQPRISLHCTRTPQTARSLPLSFPPLRLRDACGSASAPTQALTIAQGIRLTRQISKPQARHPRTQSKNRRIRLRCIIGYIHRPPAILHRHPPKRGHHNHLRVLAQRTVIHHQQALPKIKDHPAFARIHRVGHILLKALDRKEARPFIVNRDLIRRLEKGTESPHLSAHLQQAGAHAAAERAVGSTAVAISPPTSSKIAAPPAPTAPLPPRRASSAPA